jgi:hypothetical protein
MANLLKLQNSPSSEWLTADRSPWDKTGFRNHRQPVAMSSKAGSSWFRARRAQPVAPTPLQRVQVEDGGTIFSVLPNHHVEFVDTFHICFSGAESVLIPRAK